MLPIAFAWHPPEQLPRGSQLDLRKVWLSGPSRTRVSFVGAPEPKKGCSPSGLAAGIFRLVTRDKAANTAVGVGVLREEDGANDGEDGKGRDASAEHLQLACFTLIRVVWWWGKGEEQRRASGGKAARDCLRPPTIAPSTCAALLAYGARGQSGPVSTKQCPWIERIASLARAEASLGPASVKRSARH